MSTTWSGRSLNKTLIAVGATYGVIHFLNAKQAMNVWSVNGH